MNSEGGPRRRRQRRPRVGGGACAGGAAAVGRALEMNSPPQSKMISSCSLASAQEYALEAVQVLVYDGARGVDAACCAAAATTRNRLSSMRAHVDLRAARAARVLAGARAILRAYVLLAGIPHGLRRR